MSLSATQNNDNEEQEKSIEETTDEASTSASRQEAPKKLHSVTVCMVPPPENEYVWQQVSEMRRILKDPGYYRWPPHANLLYPFLELGNAKKDLEFRQSNLDDIVSKLQSAMSQCPPFRIKLRQFGTFGGKQRGVLWLDPESFPLDRDLMDDQVPPLVELQSLLEEAFPSCKAQSQKSQNGFIPHMTLSHFENLDSATTAQELISIPTNLALEFILDRIYLLERIGDDGQFLRVAEIGLGQGSTSIITDPPTPFPGMPSTEDDWVHEERMKLKSRRNGKSGRGNQQRRRRPWTTRVPDTPEMIAAKRAERKAKRERLEQEEQQESQGETPSND